MKRFIIALAMLLMIGLTTISVAAPAQADTCTLNSGWICGTIKHYSPDGGLDNAIGIRCDFGDASTNHYVAEGESSSKYCRDTDQVYVRSGQEIWCKYYITDSAPAYYWAWIKKFDGTGWHKIDNLFNDGAGCTIRSD